MKGFFTILFIITALSNFAMEPLTPIGTIEIGQGAEFIGAFNFENQVKYKHGGDINNDGLDDFLTGCQRIGLYGTGLATFLGSNPLSSSPFSFYSYSDSLRRIAIPSWQGDLNGDGHNDLLTYYPNNIDTTVEISFLDDSLDYEPDLSFQLPLAMYPTVFNGGFDFNDDGYDDVVGLNDTNIPSVFVMYGGAVMDTLFDAEFIGTNDDHLYYGEKIIIGDVNGDGFPDLLHSRRPSNRMIMDIYCGGTNFGTLTRSLYFTSSSARVGPICNGDFNGDGYDDIIVVIDRQMIIYWGCDDLQFPYSFVDLSVGHDSNAEGEIFYCNINNDQYADVAMKFNNEDYIGFWLGGEQFPSEPAYYVTNTSSYWQSHFGMDLGDVNGDGHNDVVITNGGNNTTATIYSLDPVGIEEDIQEAPDAIWCYPNPFTTTTSFKLSADNRGTLNIYNITGQLIRSIGVTPNSEPQWDGRNDEGRNVSAGIYFYRFTESNTVSKTKKLLYLK
ncbi:MAG: T9SS type A sorting domain-containing protein [Candidatus Cloacimonetes bacterium]|nr:T9SS type A sorting domain-containing protein [Candidatus Cloacimonadota bacterium]